VHHYDTIMTSLQHQIGARSGGYGLVEALQSLEIEEEALGSVEKTLLQENDDRAAGAEVWAKQNRDFVDQMTQGNKMRKPEIAGTEISWG
jgi:hypothetical protein